MCPRANVLRYWAHVIRFQSREGNILSMVGFPLKKLDSHRFSGLASQCVEWFDLNIERTNREAPSPSFLQEKIKTLEITWRR